MDGVDGDNNPTDGSNNNDTSVPSTPTTSSPYRCKDYQNALSFPFNISGLSPLEGNSNYFNDDGGLRLPPDDGNIDVDEEEFMGTIVEEASSLLTGPGSSPDQPLEVTIIQLDISCPSDNRRRNTYDNVPKHIQFHLYVTPPRASSSLSEDDDRTQQQLKNQTVPEPRWNCYPPNFAKPVLSWNNDGRSSSTSTIPHLPILEINRTFYHPQGLYFVYDDNYDGGKVNVQQTALSSPSNTNDTTATSSTGSNNKVLEANAGTIEVWLPSEILERITILAPSFDHSADINTMITTTLIPDVQNQTMTSTSVTSTMDLDLERPDQLTVWNIGTGTHLSINTSSTLQLTDQSLSSTYQVVLLNEDSTTNAIADDQAGAGDTDVDPTTSTEDVRRNGGNRILHGSNDNNYHDNRELATEEENHEITDSSFIWTTGSNSEAIIVSDDDDLYMSFGGFQQVVYFTGTYDTIVVSGVAVDIISTPEQNDKSKDNGGGFCNQVIITDDAIDANNDDRNSTCSIWNDTDTTSGTTGDDGNSTPTRTDNSSTTFPTPETPPCLSSTTPENFNCLISGIIPSWPHEFGVTVIRILGVFILIEIF